MKKIIIFKEKHGNRYFDASTEKLRNAACLEIIKERFDEFWYDYDNEKPSAKNVLTEDQIAQLPTENLKIQETRKRKDYLSELRQYNEEVSFHEKVRLAIELNDGQSAYYLLLQREGGEYEGFDIENLEEV